MTDAARNIPTLPRRTFLGATAAATALGAVLAADWGGFASAAAQPAGGTEGVGASFAHQLAVDITLLTLLDEHVFIADRDLGTATYYAGRKGRGRRRL